MDDQRIGAVIRALRQRRRWRQLDLARRAGVSSSFVGRVERGRLGPIPLARIRRVVDALDAQADLVIRWQGADLGRLLDARHAAMHEVMAGLLGSLDGWQFEPEVSFSMFGERGVIDILAWHPGRRMLLVIELKTEVVDIGDLLGTMDRRRRLGPEIAERFGWKPVAVSTWVVIADSRTNRRAVGNHSGVLRAKFPVDGRRVRSWLRDPSTRIDALGFLPDGHPMGLRRPVAPTRRVRAGSRSVRRA